MRLNNYIFSSKKQRVKGTSILADVFEAICGALYIDSNYSLKLVEQKIIDRFIESWDLFIEESSNFYKSELLEFLQNKLKLTPNIRYDYEKLGPQHNLRWIAKNPKFLDQDEKEIIKIPLNLESKQFNTKKDAEKELSEIVLRYLKENDNLFERV
jgi:dsRNA-specific ribonuclease